MVLIEPAASELATIDTSHILSIIDKHASSTALILLPGVQYYTGQYLDIKKITAHAHSLDLIIGWDLAHAVGNVPVQLHEWDVDFAVWCNYKYVNSGPGAIGGLFVHSKHSQVDPSAGHDSGTGFRPRLSGWWGGERAIRFEMGHGKSVVVLLNSIPWHLRNIGRASGLTWYQNSYLFQALRAFSLATLRHLISRLSLLLSRYLGLLL